MKKNASKSFPFRFLLLLPAAGALILLFLLSGKPKAQREDYRNIASLAYDSVFLSMYPTSPFSEEDFQHYFGLNLYKASYCIPRLSVLSGYMNRIIKSENEISTIYLGIRPDKASLPKLQALIAGYPSIAFEVILASPSLDYWAGLSEREYQQTLSDYSSFLSGASGLPNAHFFFPGRLEWLIANPGSYQDTWTFSENTARTILLECTVFGGHYVTAENAALFESALESVTQRARTAPESYPDLSDRRLVFFGDSVIGNYTGSASIPGVVSGLSGAAVYNCGYGGNSAAEGTKFPISLPGIADAFVRGDLSVLPETEQVYHGAFSYLSDNPAGFSDQNLTFIINFGLNDYFDGYPVRSESDPLDTSTYTGAIRTAVNTLRTAYPNAQIILCTPSYCHFYQDGTQPRGDGNYVLEDYVSAVFSLSEELHTDVLDTCHGLGVDNSNWEQYLYQDQIHPNAAYRYLIGKGLIRLIR